MDNTALIQEVTAKANVWLNGNYDAETKAVVKSMLENEDLDEAPKRILKREKDEHIIVWQPIR